MRRGKKQPFKRKTWKCEIIVMVEVTIVFFKSEKEGASIDPSENVKEAGF